MCKTCDTKAESDSSQYRVFAVPNATWPEFRLITDEGQVNSDLPAHSDPTQDIVASQNIVERALVSDSSIAAHALLMLDSEASTVIPPASDSQNHARGVTPPRATPTVREDYGPAEGEAVPTTWARESISSSDLKVETADPTYTLVHKFARRGGSGSRLKVTTAHRVPHGRAQNTSSSSSNPFASSQSD